MPPKSTPSFFDLIDACSLPGCPVCRLVDRSVRRSLNYFFYESVNDIPLREMLRLNRGYCPEHAGLLMRPGVGSPLGIAIVYHDVMTNVLRDLPDEEQVNASTPSWTQRLSRGLGERIKQAARALSQRGRCPACEVRASTASLVIGMLVNAVPEGKILDQIEKSEGLCLPHLAQAFQHKQGEQAFKPLLTMHRRKWQALDNELAEFIRKNDHRFKHEAIGSERDAWRRALAASSGAGASQGEP